MKNPNHIFTTGLDRRSFLTRRSLARRPVSEGGFLNLRVLFGLFIMLAGVFLALLSFGPATTGFAQGTTRQEMTLAMAQALNIPQPPACVAGQEMFNDVPASNPFCPFIEELSRRGITGGCGGGNYCPDDPVTRQQMAAFLVKAVDFPNKANFNTAIGQDALVSNTTGGDNSAFGANALVSNIDGTDNNAFGGAALFSNTHGKFNNAFGSDALGDNKTGLSNSAFGDRALHNNLNGNSNTAIGAGALQSNESGASNVAVGVSALLENKGSFNTAVGTLAADHQTTGSFNTSVGHSALSGPFGSTVSQSTAVGAFAMENSKTGAFSVAVGESALRSSNGLQNVAVGNGALFVNNAGGANTAIGGAALNHLSTSDSTTSSSNTALGFHAGFNLIAGNGNVYIGRGMEGDVSGVESDHTYIRNINTDVFLAGAAVVVDLATGRIGHLASSRRYKEDIKPMETASEALYLLKPVTYRYKKEIDRTQSPAFGLIAEEVAEVNPALVARNAEGQIETVRYEMVNAMLLNEFLKEHKKVEQLKSDFQATVAQQQKQIESLTAQLREQATQIQKVSVEVETSKSATKVALNNP
jgi:Chaperone of endosialidase/S-layer homology domain